MSTAAIFKYELSKYNVENQFMNSTRLWTASKYSKPARGSRPF